jgi:hypothetical protein
MKRPTSSRTFLLLFRPIVRRQNLASAVRYGLVLLASLKILKTKLHLPSFKSVENVHGPKLTKIPLHRPGCSFDEDVLKTKFTYSYPMR